MDLKFAMENQILDDIESEEIPQAFLCCVCLDLLYKPIVLSCGHISCFWCVNKSMDQLRESHCPLCRHPFCHFPTICKMFHLLLLKMYPLTYKKRESQILEEEKEMGFFSPQFDLHACGSQSDKELDHPSNYSCGEPQTQVDSGAATDEQRSDGNSGLIKSNIVEGYNSPQNICDRNHKWVAVTDVLCDACKLLLFHPVVLNCGHVFCRSCTDLASEVLKCQVCESVHPMGFPKVCLELDQFLKEQFPEEYSIRRDSIQQQQFSCFRHESPTTGSSKGFKVGDNPREWSDLSKVHLGVGCDSCGMIPIIGDRYKCRDCLEKIGFDLCGDCYNTRSKHPGRFNQQHTSEHRFDLIRCSDFSNFSNIRLRLPTGQLEDGSTAIYISENSSDGSTTAIYIANDASENSNNGSPAQSLASDSHGTREISSTAPPTYTDNSNNGRYHNDSEPAS